MVGRSHTDIMDVNVIVAVLFFIGVIVLYSSLLKNITRIWHTRFISEVTQGQKIYPTPNLRLKCSPGEFPHEDTFGSHQHDSGRILV